MRDPSPIFVAGARVLYPAVLAASVWILLRGHNEPGGGFIGGLVAVAASLALAAAAGARAASRRLPFRSPAACAASGVLVSVLSGVPALLRGEPFLTHRWTTLDLGAVQVPCSAVMLFDAGVYLCVWGALGGYALSLVGLDESEEAA